MANEKKVVIQVLRPYPRGGTVHRPGTAIVVPEYAVESITEARPPFGRVVRNTAPAAEAKVEAEAKK